MTHAKDFRRQAFDYGSFFFTGLTGATTFLILAILGVIIGNILYNGTGQLSWHFVLGGTEQGMFDSEKAGVLPMIVGTSARVSLMTIFVLPVGVIAAAYLT